MRYIGKRKLFFWIPPATKLQRNTFVNELNAYQESARVIMAYAFGYRCHYEGLRIHAGQINRTELDFKNQAFIVNALTNYNQQPYILDSLTKNSNHSIPSELTDKLCMILLSGWVTCGLLRRSRPSLPAIEIGPADNTDLENIEQFIKSHCDASANNMRQVLTTLTEQFVKITSVWHAVDAIAKNLMQSTTGLNRNQIECILRRSPFWQFIKA